MKKEHLQVSGDPKFVGLWNQICEEADRKKTEWIADLRSRGFKAAHPNDGWVDRKNNEICFCYPQFNDGAGIGDLVMLGWPSGKLRPIRITGRRDGFVGSTYWKFEDVTPKGRSSVRLRILDWFTNKFRRKI